MRNVLKLLLVLVIALTVGSVAAVHGQSPSQTWPISSIIGLANELALRPTMGISYQTGRAAVIDAGGQIAAAAGNLADCLRVDGSSGPCGTVTSGPGATGATIVDAETPLGTENGSNPQFILTTAPNPPNSLHLYMNGSRLSVGMDYSLFGKAVTFVPAAVPQSGDTILADYRY